MLILSLHKAEIGENQYPETINLLIDLVTEGMFSRK